MHLISTVERKCFPSHRSVLLRVSDLTACDLSGHYDHPSIAENDAIALNVVLIVTSMSFSTPMFQAGVFAALFLFLLFSRRHRLPPGPPGNVTGEFKNLTMPEVFEKWRRKYGAQLTTGPSGVISLSDHLCLGSIFSFKLGTRTVVGSLNRS